MVDLYAGPSQSRRLRTNRLDPNSDATAAIDLLVFALDTHRLRLGGRLQHVDDRIRPACADPTPIAATVSTAIEYELVAGFPCRRHYSTTYLDSRSRYSLPISLPTALAQSPSDVTLTVTWSGAEVPSVGANASAYAAVVGGCPNGTRPVATAAQCSAVLGAWGFAPPFTLPPNALDPLGCFYATAAGGQPPAASYFHAGSAGANSSHAGRTFACLLDVPPPLQSVVRTITLPSTEPAYPGMAVPEHTLGPVYLVPTDRPAATLAGKVFSALPQYADLLSTALAAGDVSIALSSHVNAASSGTATLAADGAFAFAGMEPGMYAATVLSGSADLPLAHATFQLVFDQADAKVPALVVGPDGGVSDDGAAATVGAYVTRSNVPAALCVASMHHAGECQVRHPHVGRLDRGRARLVRYTTEPYVASRCRVAASCAGCR